MKTSFYSNHELKQIGFKHIGVNCQISRFANFYSPESIIIGNNVRIDDFCILSGEINIGNHIHISAYSALYGGAGVLMEDYSGLSPRCIIFSQIDDFSGEYMVGPMVSDDKIKLIKGFVKISKYCQLGANTIVFPGVIVKEGTITGAMSLIKETTDEWKIMVGIPAKPIKNRSRKLKDLV